KKVVFYTKTVLIKKSNGIFYNDRYEYLHNIATASDFSDSFCTYSYYADTEDNFIGREMHPQPLLGISEVFSGSYIGTS
ncbi:hypothetical protein MXB_386, partial [Myxobolus squamalis]